MIGDFVFSLGFAAMCLTVGNMMVFCWFLTLASSYTKIDSFYQDWAYFNFFKLTTFPILGIFVWIF